MDGPAYSIDLRKRVVAAVETGGLFNDGIGHRHRLSGPAVTKNWRKLLISSRTARI